MICIQTVLTYMRALYNCVIAIYVGFRNLLTNKERKFHAYNTNNCTYDNCKFILHLLGWHYSLNFQLVNMATGGLEEIMRAFFPDGDHDTLVTSNEVGPSEVQDHVLSEDGPSEVQDYVVSEDDDDWADDGANPWLLDSVISPEKHLNPPPPAPSSSPSTSQDLFLITAQHSPTSVQASIEIVQDTAEDFLLTTPQHSPTSNKASLVTVQDTPPTSQLSQELKKKIKKNSKSSQESLPPTQRQPSALRQNEIFIIGQDSAETDQDTLESSKKRQQSIIMKKGTKMKYATPKGEKEKPYTSPKGEKEKPKQCQRCELMKMMFTHGANHQSLIFTQYNFISFAEEAFQRKICSNCKKIFNILKC